MKITTEKLADFHRIRTATIHKSLHIPIIWLCLLVILVKLILLSVTKRGVPELIYIFSILFSVEYLVLTPISFDLILVVTLFYFSFTFHLWS